MTRLLHAEASPDALRWLTAGVFGLWCWRVAASSVYPLTVLPLSLYEPVGFLSLLPESAASVMLSPAFLRALQWLTVVTAGAAALGLGGVSCAVLACAWITVFEGIVRGFGGHVSHHDLVLLYVAYSLAVFRAADRFIPPGRWPVAATDRGAADPAGKQAAGASGLLTCAVVVSLHDPIMIRLGRPDLLGPDVPPRRHLALRTASGQNIHTRLSIRSQTPPALDPKAETVKISTARFITCLDGQATLV